MHATVGGLMHWILAQTWVDGTQNQLDALDNFYKDPLRWLPAWRWSRSGGIPVWGEDGFFGGIKDMILGVMHLPVQMSLYVSGVVWEFTVTVVGWAITPKVFEGFSHHVDNIGTACLEIIGLVGVKGATPTALLIGTLLCAIAVSVVLKGLRGGSQEMRRLAVRCLIPLALLVVLSTTSVAEYHRAPNPDDADGAVSAHKIDGKWALIGTRTTSGGDTTGVFASGSTFMSLQWIYEQADSLRNAATSAVAELAGRVGNDRFASIADSSVGCDRYTAALENQFLQSASRHKWQEAPTSMAPVISRLWESAYMDSYATMVVGEHAARRASCHLMEYQSTHPLEIQTVRDATCLEDIKTGIAGCDTGRDYSSPVERQRADLMFHPSSHDDDGLKSLLMIWSLCDTVRPVDTSSNRLPGTTQRSLKSTSANMDKASKGAPEHTKYGDQRIELAYQNSAGQFIAVDPSALFLFNHEEHQHFDAQVCAVYWQGADSGVKTTSKNLEGVTSLVGGTTAQAESITTQVQQALHVMGWHLNHDNTCSNGKSRQNCNATRDRLIRLANAADHRGYELDDVLLFERPGGLDFVDKRCYGAQRDDNKNMLVVCPEDGTALMPRTQKASCTQSGGYAIDVKAPVILHLSPRNPTSGVGDGGIIIEEGGEEARVLCTTSFLAEQTPVVIGADPGQRAGAFRQTGPVTADQFTTPEGTSRAGGAAIGFNNAWLIERADIDTEDYVDSINRLRTQVQSVVEGATTINSGSTAEELIDDYTSPQVKAVANTVETINGTSWVYRIVYAIAVFLTALFYAWSLIGLALGTLAAQFIAGIIIAMLPLLLFAMAIPIRATEELPKKVAKVAFMTLLANVIFMGVLMLLIMTIWLMSTVVDTLQGTGLVRTLLHSLVPLGALVFVNMLTKQFGMQITSIKGALVTGAGVSTAAGTAAFAAAQKPVRYARRYSRRHGIRPGRSALGAVGAGMAGLAAGGSDGGGSDGGGALNMMRAGPKPAAGNGGGLAGKALGDAGDAAGLGGLAGGSGAKAAAGGGRPSARDWLSYGRHKAMSPFRAANRWKAETAVPAIRRHRRKLQLGAVAGAAALTPLTLPAAIGAGAVAKAATMMMRPRMRAAEAWQTKGQMQASKYAHLEATSGTRVRRTEHYLKHGSMPDEQAQAQQEQAQAQAPPSGFAGLPEGLDDPDSRRDYGYL